LYYFNILRYGFLTMLSETQISGVK